MLFDWNAVAAPGQVQDIQPCAPLTLTGDGLWVCLVSSGRCTASVPSAGPLPAGAALLLPPQSVPAGHLVLSRAPLVLEPEAYPSALVLANFKDKDVDTLLDLMKQAQVNIPLKAVVTPANRSWVFGDLLAHLQEEHTAFTAAKENQTR